jgi:hypothetical protein
MTAEESWIMHKELSELFDRPITAENEEREYKTFMQGWICGEKQGRQNAAKELEKLVGAE